jgi:hypothetical protein
MFNLSRRQFNQLSVWIPVGLIPIAILLYVREDYIRLTIVLFLLVSIPAMWIADIFYFQKLINILKLLTDEEVQDILKMMEHEDPERAKDVRNYMQNRK